MTRAPSLCICVTSSYAHVSHHHMHTWHIIMAEASGDSSTVPAPFAPVVCPPLRVCVCVCVVCVCVCVWCACVRTYVHTYIHPSIHPSINSYIQREGERERERKGRRVGVGERERERETVEEHAVVIGEGERQRAARRMPAAAMCACPHRQPARGGRAREEGVPVGEEGVPVCRQTP